VTPPPTETRRRIKDRELPVTIKRICVCEPSHYVSEAESIANADFIVLACNSHEAMLAALKGVLRVADRKTVEFDAAGAAINLAEAKT